MSDPSIFMVLMENCCRLSMVDQSDPMSSTVSWMPSRDMACRSAAAPSSVTLVSVISMVRRSGLMPGLLDGGGGGRGRLALAQLEDRAVDGELEVRLPAGGRRARLGQHPGVELHHVAVGLGPGDEHAGRDGAQVGVVPAQEGLEAQQPARGEVDGRLEYQLRLAVQAKFGSCSHDARGVHAFTAIDIGGPAGGP